MRTSSSFLFILFLLAMSTAGCGVRTGLQVGDDGGSVGFDGSVRDMGLDAPWDGGGCTSNAQCDDDLICNGEELCVGGHCQRGTPTNCDDGISCTTDACVEGGGCVSRPNDAVCRPGSHCDPMIGCVPNTTRCTSNADCDDHLACDGFETCDPGTGQCFAGPPMFCDDGVTCTDDQCIEGAGCIHSANPAECPSGLICDSRAGCVMRVCGPTGFCDDMDPCNGVETCSADGRCLPGPAPSCNDGSACTVDFCQPFAGCMHLAMPEICSDGTDNDCNGLLDCSDPACFGIPSCAPMFDGGFRDGGFMGDVGVCSFPENCHNGLDDDCNGRTDCDDPFCRMTDPGCSMMCTPTAPFERRCNDGIDDDCNGRIDCADMACRGRAGCVDAGVRDGGGAPDAGFDAGMTTTSNELGIAACTNGLDDDRDGRADCLDPDCRPFGPMGECCNGIDDTGDGNIDEFTCRCFDNSFCGGVGSLDQVCWTSSYSVCAPRCNFYGGNTFCQMNLPGMPTCNMMTGECQ